MTARLVGNGQGASAFERWLNRRVRPLARRVVYEAFEPPAVLRPVYAALFDAHFVAREAYEWGLRSLVATPVFLARCASHGRRVAVDRIPYVTGPCRIALGDDVRFSGEVIVHASSHGHPALTIGSGVFVGHGTTFDVASSITIGDRVSIGSGTYVADTEGHSQYAPDKPIWEIPASPADIAPVVIEDGVQIGKRCVILKGVRVGARSVLGTGTVLRVSIPPDSVVVGNPARVVKRLGAAAASTASKGES